MQNFARLDDAILTTLKACVAQLQLEDDSLAMVACGMVEDLTGFFVAGAGSRWLAELTGDRAEKAEYAWEPSEWPLSADDPSDVAPGRVTSAIWELSGTQAEIDGTGEELDDDAYDALRKDYEQRIVLALNKLRATGDLQRTDGSDIWVWLHSADYSDPKLDERSFRALQNQDPALVADFKARFKKGCEPLLARLIPTREI